MRLASEIIFFAMEAVVIIAVMYWFRNRIQQNEITEDQPSDPRYVELFRQIITQNANEFRETRALLSSLGSDMSNVAILMNGSGVFLEAINRLRAKMDDVDLHFQRDLSSVIGAIKGFEPAQVHVTETDAKLPAILERLEVALKVSSDRSEETGKLTAGLIEVAKSLAEVAYRLEKADPNSGYKEYAKRESDTGGEAMVMKLIEEFGMDPQEATTRTREMMARKAR